MAYLVSIRDGAPHIKFPLAEVGTIGRSSECEIQVLDTELSRRNTQLRRRDDGGWEIEDLGSRNGTWVDGVRIAGPTPLADGADVRVGGHRFAFNPPLDVLGDRDGERRLFLVRDEPPAVRAARTLGELAPADALAAQRLAFELVAGGLALPALVQRIAAALGAERGFLLAVGEGGYRPLVIHAEGRGIAVSTTLLSRVVRDRAALVVDDALGDVSFAGADSVMQHELRAVMMAPLLAAGAEPGGDRVIGVLQLDHARRGAFDEATLARLVVLAEAAAVILARSAARPAAAPPPDHGFVGGDPRVAELLATVARAAAAPSRVLITGESGTGKELIARMIHDGSARRDGPWIAVNCAAIAETLLESELFGHEKGAFTGALRRKRGCFEQADGGTLFLDEIGELTAGTQAKLLRVLQESRFYRVGGEQPIDVDVRVIAATNRDLRRLVAAGGFREDLYFRLGVIPLAIPPLRERPGDLVALTEYFLARIAGELGRRPPRFSDDAWLLWRRHPWPGNVRELKNLVERLVVLHEGQAIGAAELPAEIGGGAGGGGGIDDGGAAGRRGGVLADAVASLERELVVAALAQSGGNKTAAARALGISRPTLDKKIKDHELEEERR